ncbi:MAG: hypothetical protein H6709_00375 [Kofleriaceae bacterium]|nr:hypothetical protein [Kofleriaceae bacterium]
MKILGSVLVSAALATTAAPALAAPARPIHATTRRPVARTKLMRVDAAAVPAACRVYLTGPGMRPSAGLVGAQRISLAMCQAGALDHLALSIDDADDVGDAMKEVQAAAAPTIAELRDVIAHGTPRDALIAADRLGDLDRDLVVRLQSAVPLTGPDLTADARDLALHAQIATAAQPLDADATRAFADVARITTTHPLLRLGDPVVRDAINEAAHTPATTARR